MVNSSRRNVLRTLAAAPVVAAVGAIPGFARAAAPEFSFKFGHNQPTNHPLHIRAQEAGRLGQDAAQPPVPIIALSASVLAEDRALERVHNLLAGVQSRPRAVCGVANPRHSYGYVCGLRLAAHPDPHPAPLRVEIMNTF